MTSGTIVSAFPFRRLVPTLSLLLCLALPLAVVAMPHGPRVLVVASPGSDAAAVLRIIAAADGRLVSSTLLDWAAVAEGGEADFTSRLLAAGAVLVLDASAIAGCETQTRDFRGKP